MGNFEIDTRSNKLKRLPVCEVRVEAALTLRALAEVDPTCVGGLTSYVVTIINALREILSFEKVRSSVKLKRIIQTILFLGNALNHGTARDSLLKLTETRSHNSKMTLMHYLCKVLAKKLLELLDYI